MNKYIFKKSVSNTVAAHQPTIVGLNIYIYFLNKTSIQLDFESTNSDV